MELTKKQRKALFQMAEALGELAEVWTDEMQELFEDTGLLPSRDLLEAQSEYIDIAASPNEVEPA